MDNTETRTHWKRLVNPDYIGVYALPNGGDDMVVEIDFVTREEVTGAQGKKDECTVAHLKGQKPLILNATNSKSIHKLYGPYIEDWRGKKITLFASSTKLAGEVVECLRIRPQAPAAGRDKPPIHSRRFDEAMKSIREGRYTVAKLENQFSLTKEQVAFIANEFGGNNV